MVCVRGKRCVHIYFLCNTYTHYYSVPYCLGMYLEYICHYLQFCEINSISFSFFCTCFRILKVSKVVFVVGWKPFVANAFCVHLQIFCLSSHVCLFAQRTCARWLTQVLTGAKWFEQYVLYCAAIPWCAGCRASVAIAKALLTWLLP